MSKTKEIKAPKWEVKDRRYYLLGNKEPLTYTLASKNSRRHPLLWFDESTNIQREIRYATNQNSPLVDEQKGEVTLGHIIFEDGVLAVSREKQNLQKLLSLYHPKKGIIYQEYQAEVIAHDELEDISQVNNLTSKELRRDLLIMAKKNPSGFLDIASDENVGLRNVGIVAVEKGIIKISQDQREFLWGSNDRKLMTVPFDENPYSALAAWFKTDEGVEVFKTIKKKLQ